MRRSHEPHVVLTDFTPPTVRVTSDRLVYGGLGTDDAASVTTPLNVSTLISSSFRVGGRESPPSLWRCDGVIDVLSGAFGSRVAAQPMAAASAAARNARIAVLLQSFIEFHSYGQNMIGRLSGGKLRTPKARTSL